MWGRQLAALVSMIEMMMSFYKRFFLIFFFSLVAGCLTALAYVVSLDGKFNINNITLPAVAEIAFTIGVISGAILSPLGYWCLKDKRLMIVLPLLYFIAFIVTVIVTLLLRFFGFYFAFLFWIFALIFIKFFAPKSWQN
jgi:hypothetical protein